MPPRIAEAEAEAGLMLALAEPARPELKSAGLLVQAEAAEEEVMAPLAVI